MCDHNTPIFTFVGMQEDAQGGGFPLWNCSLCNSTISEEQIETRLDMGHPTYILTEIAKDKDGTVDNVEGAKPPFVDIIRPMLPRLM